MTAGFIYETPNNQLPRFFALLGVVLLAIAGIVILVMNTGGLKLDAHWYERFIPDLVHDITPLKLLYISMLGGMIFFPIPVELAFFFSIDQGHSAVLCTVAAVTGFVIGNTVNYLVGLKLNKHVSYLLSAKKFFALRRKVNKWGKYAIVLLNVLPAPSDILTVGLGTIRYNVKRLFALIIISNIIKFALIALFAQSLHGLL